MASTVDSVSTSYANMAIIEQRRKMVFSQIIKVALAALGIVTSYAFLPPIGATIASSIIFIVTLVSVYKSINQTTRVIRTTSSMPASITVETPPTIVINPPVRRRWFSYAPSWFFWPRPVAPTPTFPVGHAPVPMPPPVRHSWYSPRPSWFWTRPTPMPTAPTISAPIARRSLARETLRESTSIPTTRVPVGDRRATPTATPPLASSSFSSAHISSPPPAFGSSTRAAIGAPSRPTPSPSFTPSATSSMPASSPSTTTLTGNRVPVGNRRR